MSISAQGGILTTESTEFHGVFRKSFELKAVSYKEFCNQLTADFSAVFLDKIGLHLHRVDADEGDTVLDVAVCAGAAELVGLSGDLI